MSPWWTVNQSVNHLTANLIVVGHAATLGMIFTLQITLLTHITWVVCIKFVVSATTPRVILAQPPLVNIHWAIFGDRDSHALIKKPTLGPAETRPLLMVKGKDYLLMSPLSILKLPRKSHFALRMAMLSIDLIAERIKFQQLSLRKHVPTAKLHVVSVSTILVDICFGTLNLLPRVY